MALRVAVVCLAAATTGCAHPTVGVAYKARVDGVLAAHQHSSKPVPALTTLDGKPWKVGQWALYKRSTSPGDLGYEMISVVATDPCGIWIEIESQGYDDRSQWTLCLRPAAADGHTDDIVQVAIREGRGRLPEIVDFRTGPSAEHRASLAPVVARLVPPRWPEDGPELAREDLDVPAGHFAGAIRSTERTAGPPSVDETRWAHPDVPFDATVRRKRSDGREDVLLAYGDEGARSILPELKAQLRAASEPTPTPGLFIGFGTGGGWFSGASGQAGSRVATSAGVIGMRLTAEVDLIAEFGGVYGARYAPDRTLQQATAIGLVGARWSPFRLSHLEPRWFLGASALYVQADLGYTEFERVSTTEVTTVARGLALGAAVGWLGCQARDWVVGLELSDHLAVFDAGEGVRHSVELTGLLQIYLPLAW